MLLTAPNNINLLLDSNSNMLHAIFIIILLTVAFYYLSSIHVTLVNPQGKLKRFDLSKIANLEGEEEIRVELMKAEAILRSIQEDAKFCVPLQRINNSGEILVPEVGAYSDDDRKAFGDVKLTTAVPIYMSHYMLDKIKAINEVVNEKFSIMSIKYNIDSSKDSVIDQYKVLKNIFKVFKKPF